MATFNDIIVFHLQTGGTPISVGDTVIGVYEMDVIDSGGTDFSGNSISENTIYEMQLYYFSTSGQSFTINGVQYLDATSVDNGYIEIDGVEIGGSILGFPDPNTGNEDFFFVPNQNDAADAYTVQAGDTITRTLYFPGIGMDGDAMDYADMYTGYTPPLDYIVEGTSGADTIDASYTGDPEGDMIDANDAADGSNDDSIEGGAGLDYIYAGSGDDTISTGADGAVVFPGGGNDLIQGSDVNDRVEPSAGDDTMVGGLGNDLFWGGDGNDSIDGGPGGDQIRGGAGDDTIDTGVGYGSDDAFSLVQGGAGNDLIYIGDAGSSISGDDGDDTIYGAISTSYINAGAGNDLLIDGGAQDTMLGGEGSDEIRLNAGGNKVVYTGTGSTDDADDVITWTGGGQILLRDFGVGDTGLTTDGDQTNNDFIDLSAFYSGYTEMRADLADDNRLNHSVGDFSDNTAISGYIIFQNSSGANYMSATDLTYDNTNVTCFSADVRVLTMAGERRVGDIEKGEFVLTMDHGYRPVRWVGRRFVSQQELDANPHLHPIRITKGALGNNTPCRDLIVSPQHRIYVRSAIIQRMTGQAEGLMAAKHLLGIQGVEIAYDMAEITYVHIMFDEHEVIYSEGAASESFYTGAVAMNALDQAARREIIELFPELAQDDCPPPIPARPLLPGRIGRKITARHGMNSKPLVA